MCVLFCVGWLLIIRSKRRVRMLTGIKDFTKSRHCELSREEGESAKRILFCFCSNRKRKCDKGETLVVSL